MATIFMFLLSFSLTDTQLFPVFTLVFLNCFTFSVLCSLLTVLILVILPDDSQQTVMLMCSVTQLMGVSAVNSRIKDPAAVVIAAVRRRHQTKRTSFSRILFSTEL